MKKLFESLVTLLLIHKCFLCGRPVSGEGFLCNTCALPSVKAGELCPFCGKRSTDCQCRRLGDARYDFACAPLFYTDAVAHGIHKFKYEGRRYYGDYLAPLMYAQLLQTWPEVRFDLVTWVPMHPRKERKRGFCQSELLAKRLGAMLDAPVQGSLLRNTGEGGAQMEQKGGEARQKNARLSYEAVPGAQLFEETVLLVDDVLTTGWTGARCGELLHELGAKRVYLLTAATTVRRTTNPEREKEAL